MTVTENRRARLAQLVDQFGSQAELVRRSGERQGEISGLLRNKSFGERKARKIENNLKLPAGWLDKEVEVTDELSRSDPEQALPGIPQRDASEVDLADYVIIQQLKTQSISQNAEGGTDSEEMDRAFPRSWLTRLGVRAELVAFVIANSTGMQPHIPCEAILLLDQRNTALRHGRVHVIRFQDEILVRRIFKMPNGGVSVRADHPDKAIFPDIDLGPSQLHLICSLGQVEAAFGRV